MKRYDILDGFRGYFLVFMMVNHLAFEGGSQIARINHSELGYVQDAQGFIFISGLIVGLYYARGYLKGNGAAMDRKIVARAGLLYRYTLALLALVFGLALALPDSQALWGRYFQDFYVDPATTAAGAAMLAYQPTYMDILPQYIFYLLASPILIRLTLAGHGAAVMAGSVLMWLGVQIGLHLPLIAAIEGAGGLVDGDFVTRGAFNPLAWQLVFVSGLVIGAGISQGTLRLGDWFDPRRPAPFLAALGLVVLFMGYRLGFTLGVVPEMLAERFAALDNRNEFSLIYAVNFAALGYVVTWVLRCGAGSGSAALAGAGRVLRALFDLRFLRFIGKHSLQVYAYHVAVVFLVFAIDGRYGPLPEWLKAAITLAGIASLALPAWLHGRSRPPAAAAGRVGGPARA